VFVSSNETGNGHPMFERHGLAGHPTASGINGTQDNGLYRSLGGTGGMPLTAFDDAEGRVLTVARGALVDGALDQALAQVYGITPGGEG